MLKYFDNFSALFGKNIEACRQRLQFWRNYPSSKRSFEYIWKPNGENSIGNIRSKREAKASTENPIATTNALKIVSGSASANRFETSIEAKNSKIGLSSSVTKAPKSKASQKISTGATAALIAKETNSNVTLNEQKEGITSKLKYQTETQEFSVSREPTQLPNQNNLYSGIELSILTLVQGVVKKFYKMCLVNPSKKFL